jgi:uncharacterized DUF497 family protein
VSDEIKFDWDEANRNHLAAHDVTPEEFEQMFHNPRFETRQQRKSEERVWCLGRADSGRLLTAVYTDRQGRIRAVTAHIMKRKFRRLYVETIAASECKD